MGVRQIQPVGVTMDATRAIQIAVARADLFICQARASPWLWVTLCALSTWAVIRLVRRCLK